MGGLCDKARYRCGQVLQNGYLRRFLFYAVIVGFAALTINDVTKLVKQYVNGDKKANMNIVFNETMTFPNVTFCMSKAQAWSHFPLGNAESMKGWDEAVAAGAGNLTTREDFLNKRWDWRMVVEAYQVVGNLRVMEVETSERGMWHSAQVLHFHPQKAEMRRMIRQWLGWIAERNISFAEFEQKVGRETLQKSLQRFQRLDSPEARSDIKITWLSLMELCFQPVFPTQKDFAPIAERGDIFVLSVSHNEKGIAVDQVPCMSFDVHGSPSAKARLLRSRGATNDGFNSELCLGMEHEAHVEVAARYVSLPNSEPATKCKLYAEGEESQFECQSRCRLESIRRMCGCTALSLSHLADEVGLAKYPLCGDYTKCGGDAPTPLPPSMTRSNNSSGGGGVESWNEKSCVDNCFPDCVQLRYALSYLSVTRSRRSDLTSLTLTWGSLEYLQLEQEYVYELFTLLAAVGGGIGLWLGLCVLSLFQLTTWLTWKTTQGMKKSVQKGVNLKPIGALRAASQRRKNTLKSRECSSAPAAVGALSTTVTTAAAAAKGGDDASKGTLTNSSSDKDVGAMIAMTETSAFVHGLKAASKSSAMGAKNRLSANPFGGPIAKNPFESQFKKKRVGSKPSTAGMGGEPTTAVGIAAMMQLRQRPANVRQHSADQRIGSSTIRQHSVAASADEEDFRAPGSRNRVKWSMESIDLGNVSSNPFGRPDGEAATVDANNNKVELASGGKRNRKWRSSTVKEDARKREF